MLLARTRLSRLICLAIDHRPQVTERTRSGARFLVCTRCNRFLGIAGAPSPTPVARGLTAAAKFLAEVKTKSAH